MTDHAEEQAMEAEALEAIFDTHFEAKSSTSWAISIYPDASAEDNEELNHVACRLLVSLPTDYPESSVPEINIEIIKGLADEHQEKLKAMALEEAEANIGVPSMFAVAERLREWLAENNVKGLDDVSMHAQMMRKQQEAEKAQRTPESSAFEAQKKQEEMTEAEREELEVRKRRAEGTPCTMENFLEWKAKFEKEQQDALALNEQEEAAAAPSGRKKDGKTKEVDKSGRKTGFEYFSSKTTNLEALEAAAEEAENEEMEEDQAEALDNVDEELFEDDVDLDDLDFDEDDDDVDI